MMSTPVVVDYALENLGPCLRLVDAQHLLPVLHRAMPGWRLIPCEPQQQAPDICVWRHPDGFWQEAPALPDGMLLDTPAGTACSVIADVTGAYLRGHPQLVGIHCGAVEINNQLVIFPDSHRAGKSTLTAAFAAAGCRVFGDDVLALNRSGEGIALGVAPRLRLPLPEALAPAFHQFVANHLGPHDERYGYLALNDQQQAAHGAKSPLGSVLLIDRDTTLTEPQLVPLQPGDGLWQLLQQNFAEHESDHALIERFMPLLQRSPCFLLRYGDAYDAAQWLTNQWAETSWPAKRAPTTDAEKLNATPGIAANQQAAALGKNDKRCWKACTAAYEFPLGDELFVIAKEDGAIHRLNVTGRAVWALLQQEALSMDDVTDTLVAFFAGANRVSVERDIAYLLGQLVNAGLVQPVLD